MSLKKASNQSRTLFQVAQVAQLSKLLKSIEQVESEAPASHTPRPSSKDADSAGNANSWPASLDQLFH
jgi:hypothetical protein